MINDTSDNAVTNTFNHTNFHALCNELAQREIIFKRIIEAYNYPPFWNRKPGFETLIHIILEQQVSLASARAAYHKLKAQLIPFTPKQLLKLSDETLRACYFSRQKSIYAKHLAQCIVTGDLRLHQLHLYTNETIALNLQQVKGIGHWTSDVYLMMALQRTDCFPIGDVALVNSMKHELELDKLTSKEKLLSIAEKWRPYRTIAAYLLWHAYLSKKGQKQ